VSDRLTLLGHGHPAVRASHGKTLELTPSSELGAGGTCVVAVGARVDGVPLAGALRGELSVGDQHVTFEALGNPDWDTSGPAVLRRSDVRKPDTIATHASVSAAELPAELRAALRDPGAQVRLVLRRSAPQPDRLVIAAGEVAAGEREAADLITETDPSAVTGRVLHLGRPAPALLLGVPQPVEVVGLDPAVAVAVASPHGAGGEVRRIAAADFEKTIRSARRHGHRTGAVLGRLPWVRWGELATLQAPSGVRTVWVCLDPAPVVDVDERIAELREQGLSVKQIARTLASELGLPSREIYRRVVETHELRR